MERDKSNAKARTISMIAPSSETDETVEREFAESLMAEDFRRMPDRRRSTLAEW